MEQIIKLTPNELYRYIKCNIKYGFVDKDNNKYYPKDFGTVNIDELYILQTPENVILNKCAWCWDIVELYRYYFDKNNIPNETYYLEYKNNQLNIHQTHTFILFFYNNKWYNIEDNSSNNENGIFEYTFKADAIETISNSFRQYIKEIFKLSDVGPDYICNKYSKPHYSISSIEFQNWCKKEEERCNKT